MDKKEVKEKLNEHIIQLHNISKFYHMGKSVVKALDDVDIHIRRGDFVAIMGPSGSGKCVLADTKIALSNGLIKNIQDLENEKNINLIALNKKNFKTQQFKISNFFKRKVKNYLEIKTSSGKKISVTEEHPFFTLNKDGFSEIIAKNLRHGKFVAMPRFIKINGKSQNLNAINRLSLDKSLIIPDSKKIFNKFIKNNHLSFEEISKILNIDKSTCVCWSKKNNISLYNLRRLAYAKSISIEEYLRNLNLTALSSNKVVNIPKKTSPELLEIYGFIVGDGNIDKDGIKITNFDKKLKERINYLSAKVFQLKPKEFISTRLDLNTRVLRSFFNLVLEMPLQRKAQSVKIPSWMFKCPDKEIASFIRGLFDCDSYVSKDKKEIVITLASPELIKQLEILLLRFGITARYSDKMTCATNTEDKTLRKYYSLSLSGLENLQKYLKHIGFNSDFKLNRLKKHINSKKISNTNVDIIPCGELIKELRKNSEIILPRKIHDLLGAYESNNLNPSRNKLEKIIKLFQHYKIPFSQLKLLTEADIFWDRIISVKKINKLVEVYDLEVPDANNFIANGFIIHNSTGMNLVGSLDLATKGAIYLDGTNIEHLTESELAQVRGKKIGFIFQQFNLIPNLTAKENVMLPMMFQNIDEKDRIERAMHLLNLVGLGDRIEHYPTQLSGGQQQRVAIARALANDPEVILADEPTGNLDTKSGEHVMKFLEELHKKGKTIIMVTHSPELAHEHAEIIYWLKDGKVEKVTKKEGKRWVNVKAFKTPLDKRR
ncbi:MAG: ATP-binding cassette domain-containing protein [archaeon]|nr:ATP-binding cassette domain-containing protein [archaeon]